MKRIIRLAVDWSPMALLLIASAPIWLIFVRLWWKMTFALLTKPMAEIFCGGCLS